MQLLIYFRAFTSFNFCHLTLICLKIIIFFNIMGIVINLEFTDLYWVTSYSCFFKLLFLLPPSHLINIHYQIKFIFPLRFFYVYLKIKIHQNVLLYKLYTGFSVVSIFRHISGRHPREACSTLIIKVWKTVTDSQFVTSVIICIT